MVHETIGYLASALVLATFSARRMAVLRLLAIASNVAFIAYAALAGIGPVLVLHVLLLPMNLLRLLQARARAQDATTPPACCPACGCARRPCAAAPAASSRPAVRVRLRPR
jgi:hypothetical protein